MSKSTEILNTVQRLIIDFANKEGIDLRSEFASVEAFKQFVIAFTFKSLVDNGLEVSVAYDVIFGDGAFDKMAESIWTSAREKAATAV
jgi:hypothetical protein